MGYIIGLIIFILLAIVAMMLMTMAYHFLYGVVPIIAFIMAVAGMIVGLWNAVKNTMHVAKEVYGKK